MSGLDRVILSQEVRITLQDKKGAAFEAFFSEAAIAMWADDFEPWKPQGSVGDYKCDGYRVSAGTVFQCHAPEHPDPSRIVAKIEADFEGARQHFGERLKRWIFVHNQKEIPAKAGALLDELRQKFPDITIGNWTVTHLIHEVMKLPIAALQNLFPQFPLDQELSPEMEEWYAQRLAAMKPRIPSIEMAKEPPPNRNAFESAMDDLGEIDREVRRRLLGYSRWFDPATKAQVHERLVGLGYGEGTIETNAARLQESKLIKITQRHYLPDNLDICQQAADTLVDEFLEELEA